MNDVFEKAPYLVSDLAQRFARNLASLNPLENASCKLRVPQTLVFGTARFASSFRSVVH